MSDTTMAWYSDAEINDLCKPLTQPAAQIRYLRSEGFTVGRKPGGAPLLMRDHVALVLGGKPAAPDATEAAARQGAAPNRAALVLQFAGRRG